MRILTTTIMAPGERIKCILQVRINWTLCTWGQTLFEIVNVIIAKKKSANCNREKSLGAKFYFVHEVTFDHRTLVHFASFLSSGFITAIEINLPERKLANAPLCSGLPESRIIKNSKLLLFFQSIKADLGTIKLLRQLIFGLFWTYLVPIHPTSV